MAQEGYRVGVDVGGTFTDLICITPDGQVLMDKTPTTPDDQSVGVLAAVARLAATFGLSPKAFCGTLEAFVHGTTTADNTMIEMSGAATGLLATEGHRDEIELRRDHKEEIWDPAAPPPHPIARRRARIAIPERCDFEGNVVMALDEEAVRRGVRRLQKLGVESIVVETPTFDGELLGAGAVVKGPAFIGEPFTVVVLAPTDVAVLDEHGNYDITIGSA